MGSIETTGRRTGVSAVDDEQATMPDSNGRRRRELHKGDHPYACSPNIACNMDIFTPALLKTVFEFLPWKDRLSTRRLSSKFNSLAPYPVWILTFKIEQNKNSLLFHLKPKQNSIEPIEIIEIFKTTQKTGEIVLKCHYKIVDFTFLKTSLIEDVRQVRKMTIRCNRPNYHRFINIYMNFFLTVCDFKHLKLVYLNDNFLAKFRKTFHRIHSNFDWENEQRYIHLQTGNNTVTQEQRKFMNFCKGPHGFRYLPPGDFEKPNDFWELKAIAETKQLYLEFGASIDSCTIYTDHKIDLGIDDNFIRNLIDKKMVDFVSQGISSVTLSYLKDYVNSCVHGGYALFILQLPHNYDILQIRELWDYLFLSGFKRTNGRFIKATRQPAKEGYHPDQLLVCIHPKIIQILGDTSFHRGKISITDKRHSF